MENKMMQIKSSISAFFREDDRLLVGLQEKHTTNTNAGLYNNLKTQR